MKKCIAYFRVSPKRQRKTGLSLEGQRTAVADYLAREKAKMIGLYVEVESRKNKTRPELLRAIDHARESKATLIVAKLDRLIRNVAFLSSLKEAKIDFAACDNPQVNPSTINSLTDVARIRVEQISARIKAALAAAKAGGEKLGSNRRGHWKGREKARQAGLAKAQAAAAESHRQRRQEAYAHLLPVIVELRDRGESLQSIADFLSNEGNPTRTGKERWTRMQVLRVLRSIETNT